MRARTTVRKVVVGVPRDEGMQRVKKNGEGEEGERKGRESERRENT